MNSDYIKILDKTRKQHSKASEEYIEVKFTYPECNREMIEWIPVEYRRTGVSVKTEDELWTLLNETYEQMNPKNYDSWLEDQERFWAEEKPKAKVTKSFFDALKDGKWKCVESDLPSNPNWARRVQDLKEMGYTLATNTSKYCEECKANKTHLMLLPIPRGNIQGNGYEVWSPKLRKRILKVLDEIDVYENKVNKHALPDHKFSEIRWDENTKEDNLDHMTDQEIKDKFQLLTNQRNQQKREVCRTCYQTDKRGKIFDIPFYYEGNEDWDPNIPKKGKDAESGCVGCGWYDVQKWREELTKLIIEFEERGRDDKNSR